MLRASQCGGLPHKGVDMASFLVRSSDAFAGVARRSTLNVFMDVRTAYYSAARELVVDLPALAGDRADLLDSVPIPALMADGLEMILGLPGILGTELDDTHLIALVADAQNREEPYWGFAAELDPGGIHRNLARIRQSAPAHFSL